MALSLALLGSSRCWSAETGPGPAPASPEVTNSQDTLRAYLQLQEQLHATQLAIEQSRKESGEAAARLQTIEQALTAQRLREMEAAQSSNRSLFLVAGSFGFLGLLALLLMAYFQWRTVNRLAEISSAALPARGLLPVPPAAEGQGRLLSAGALEQTNQRLFSAVERLEARIYELEHAAGQPSLKAPATRGSEFKVIPAPGNGKAEPAAPHNGRSVSTATAEPVSEPALADLLGKGQAYLNQNQTEAALACFESALKVAPACGEALLKKGLALERLERFEESLACYEHAMRLQEKKA